MSQTGWTHVDKFVSSATFLQGDTVIKNSLMLRTGVSWKKHRDHKLPLLRFAGSSKFRLLLWPALVPCLADPLRREIGHCAFLAPARLACTSTPAVFNFGDFWLELATRMVSTGLNQAGWGRSIRPRAKFDPAWTELGGWDNSRYVWILHTDSGSAAFAVDPSQLSPRYTMLLGGDVLGGGGGHPSQHSTAWCNIAEGNCDPSTALLFLIVLAFSRGVAMFFCLENIKCLID